MRRFLTVAVAAGLLVAVLVVFWRAGNAEFVLWDDDTNITQNPHIHGLSAQTLAWMFTDFEYMRRYVPFTWLNWATEYALFGLTTRSAHVGNILFHGANTLLVFVIIRIILQATGVRKLEAAQKDAHATTAAGFACLLWAIHPLRVEPVAWASGRIYCVATFFLLLSVYLYLKAGREGETRRWWVGGAWLAYVSSLLTYPLGVTYAVILLLIDRCVLGRIGGAAGWRHRGVWFEKFTFAMPAVLITAATLWTRLNATGIWQDTPAPTFAEFGITERIAQACYVAVQPLLKTMMPAHLSPTYTALVSFSPFDAAFIARAGVFVAITGAAWWYRKRLPALLGLWLAYLALMAPMLGWTEHPHYANDRYGHLATITLSIGCAAALVLVAGRHVRWTLALTATFGAAIMAFGALSVRQVANWQNTPALFAHVLTELGDHPYRQDILARLGEYWFSRGDFDAAKKHYEAAVRIEPRNSVPWAGLGRIAEERGDLATAVDYHQRAFRLSSRDADLARRLGVAALRHGSTDQAVLALEDALRLEPADAATENNLAAAFMKLGRLAEAEKHARRAVELAPDMPDFHCNHATTLLLLGHANEARAEYEGAARLQPGSPAPEIGLGDTYRSLGDTNSAIAHYERGLQLDPNAVAVRVALGSTLARAGRNADAVRELSAALAMAPENVVARFNLGLVFAASGEAQKAREQFALILQLQPENEDARRQLALLTP